VTIQQTGPAESLAILRELVTGLSYKPGWVFELRDVDRGQGCSGTTLLISATVPDSWNPQESVGFLHLMPVPAAAYNRRSWTRWLFRQILDVETHEALEFFKVDGEPPYFPSHAPGWHPYDLREVIPQDAALAPSVPYTGRPGSRPDHLLD
jgi:hypothetical protein